MMQSPACISVTVTDRLPSTCELCCLWCRTSHLWASPQGGRGCQSPYLCQQSAPKLDAVPFFFFFFFFHQPVSCAVCGAGPLICGHLRTVVEVAGPPP